MIEFVCSELECRRKLEVEDDLAGKKVRCPKCKTVMVVPRPDPATGAGDSTGYEATMALEEEDRVGEWENGGVREGERTNEDGVEALDVFLEDKRGRRAPFEVEKEIAHGGMGAVILARDKAIQRELAVKVMRPQIADSEEHRLRFLEEAQVTGQLEHPNIVPIHELGKDAEGNLYFTMKLVKGKSLGEILTELRDEEVSRKDAKTQSEGGRRKGKGSSPERRPQRGSALQSRGSSEGEEKNSALESQATLSLSDLLGIYSKVCDGMAFAHSRGVIHRDLKPDNIMVGEFGEVQIMDWGLAKVAGTGNAERGTRNEEKDDDANIQTSAERSSAKGNSVRPNIQRPSSDAGLRSADTVSASSSQDRVSSIRADSDVALTMEGTVSGTPAYMPPEQAEGKIDLIDHRSDIYSLGAILYEILTLERPVEGKTSYEVLLKVAEGKIVPPGQRAPDRGIPKELSAVAMKAMEKNRRKRYQSVPELAQDIKLFLEGRGVSAKEDSLAESLTKLVKRNKGVSAAIGVATAVVLAVICFAFARITGAMTRAMAGEREAVEARDEQRRTASEASQSFAEQAVQSIEAGRLGEAQVRAEAAQKLAPWGPWGSYALGKLAAANHDLAEAAKLLRQACDLAPNDGICRAALAQVLSRSEGVDQAHSLLAGESGTENWKDFKSAADALYGAGQYREAEKAYQQTLEKVTAAAEAETPGEAWRALFEKAKAHLALEAYPEARAALNKARARLTATGAPPQAVLSNLKESLEQAEQGLEELKKQLADRQGQSRAWVMCEGFAEEIRLLPANEQFRRIEAKLEEIHGRMTGVRAAIEDGAWKRVELSGHLRYLQPFKGLPLEGLELSATCSATDLAPLRGMPLKSLDLDYLRITDLGALRGMPLSSLKMSRTAVSDLGPLRGAPLRELSLKGVPVSDLSPLAEAPLESLTLSGTDVTDLGPLSETPLHTLFISCEREQRRGVDLSPLRGTPLSTLTLYCGPGNPEVLGELPLKTLVLRADIDLAPLGNTPLESLELMWNNTRNLDGLTGLRLQRLRLSQCYNARDVSALAGMPLRSLELSWCFELEDISPLRGLPLTSLTISLCKKIKSLEALKGMPLEKLVVNQTPVTDLAPLRGLPLKHLNISGTPVVDLSPLAGMELETLSFTLRTIKKGIDVIRQMKGLKSICGGEPKDFWKKYDAGELK